MKNDLISVIILTYKHGNYLYETIDSVLSQDYPNIEIIIAEDGDPLFKREAIELYLDKNAGVNIKNIVFSINEENMGTVKNINNAIQKSSGGYIKIIAGDDTYPNKEVFSKQIESLGISPSALLVVGDMNECDSAMNIKYEVGFGYESKEYFDNRDLLLRIITREKPQLLSTQAICFRRVYFEKYGLFDDNFRLIEDLPMAVKIVTQNIEFSYINFPCVNHRGAVGVSSTDNRFDKKKIAYYNDLKRYFEVTLQPYSGIVGERYVKMRIELYNFRIKYTETEDNPFKYFKRIILIIRYFCPIVYYCRERIKK